MWCFQQNQPAIKGYFFSLTRKGGGGPSEISPTPMGAGGGGGALIHFHAWEPCV